MAIIDIKRTVSLDGAIMPVALEGTLYGGEKQAHRFIINATKDGAALNLTGSVTASFLRKADDAEVPLTGEIIGGGAAVTLEQSCYTQPGRFELTIFLTQSGSKTALYSCNGNVRNTSASEIVDPGHVVPDITDIIAEYARMQAASEAAEAAAENANEAAKMDAHDAYINSDMQVSGRTYQTLRPGSFELLQTGALLDVISGNEAQAHIVPNSDGWNVYKYDFGQTMMIRLNDVERNLNGVLLAAAMITDGNTTTYWSMDEQRKDDFFLADAIVMNVHSTVGPAANGICITSTAHRDFEDVIVCADRVGEFDNIIAFGDSIFAGDGLSAGQGVVAQFASMMGLPVTNYAVGGATLTTRQSTYKNLVQQVRDYRATIPEGTRPSGTPLYILDGGTNDPIVRNTSSFEGVCHWNINMGQYGTDDTLTIYGAIKTCINDLLELGIQPWQIVVTTPIPKGIRANNAWGFANWNAAQYVEAMNAVLTAVGYAMYEVGVAQMCNVINGYRSIFGNLDAPESRLLMMTDDTHPTRYGAQHYAERIFTLLGRASQKEVTSLKSAFEAHDSYAASQIGLPSVNITDISGYSLHNGALGSEGNWSNVNSNYQHVVIKVPQTGCRFQCKVSSNSPASLYYTFASKYDEPINGKSYYAVTSAMPSGNSRGAISVDGSLSVNLDDAVKYIILNTVWNENTVVIESVSLTKDQTDGAVQTWLNSVSASLAAPYSNARPYQVGEHCVYNNRVYQCVTAIKTPGDWNAAYWVATDLGTAIDGMAHDHAIEKIETDLTGYLSAPAVNISLTDLAGYQSYYGLMSKKNGTWGSIRTSTNQYVIVPVPRPGCMFAIENGNNIVLNVAGLKTYTPPKANGERIDLSNFGFKTIAAGGSILGIPVTADTRYLAIQTLVGGTNASLVSFTLTNQAVTGYLTQQIGTPEINITDLSGYEIRNGALGSNGNWSNINSNYKNIVIPVPQKGCRLRIKVASGSSNLIFAGVTKLTDPVNGQSYYADSTLGRRSLSASSGLTGYDVPDDVKYIILNIVWNTNDIAIESFSLSKGQSNGEIQNDLYDLKNARPMLSIIDDDGQRGSWNNWEEIGDELGITASFALITGSVGAANYITWAEVDRLMGKGYGMLSHTDGHIHMASTSDSDMEQDFIATTAALRQHGVRDMYLVYPYGEHPASMTLVKKYFQCGVMTGADNINQPPIDRWNIYRCSVVQSGDDNKIDVEYEGQTYSVPRFKTFSEFKSIIDNAIEKRAFLVLMTHLRNYPPTGYYYDSAAKAVLEQALTYAAEHGVDIVPFAEGYNRFVNRFESADVTVDCNGNVID